MKNNKLILATALIALILGPLAAGRQPSGNLLSTVFALENISPDQGKFYLSEAGVGTVSNLPGTSALVVTAAAEDIAKARVILELVDVREPFRVSAPAIGDSTRYAPTAEMVDARITGISVGSFANPPDPKAAARAIVDTYAGTLLVLAPVSRFEDVVKVVGDLHQKAIDAATKAPQQPNVGKIEPPEPADANTPVEPNQPQFVITAPQDSNKPANIYEPAPVKDGDSELSLSLPEQIEIIQLIDLVGKHLGLDFLYDPVLIKGQVTLKLNGELSGPLKVKDLYPLLEQVLKFKQFAMTRHGNIVLIVPVDQALTFDPKLVEADKDEGVAHGDVMVSRAFKLEHIDTTSAQNLLQGLQLGAIPPAPIPDARLLIVTDYAYRMPRIERIIKMIDKPGKPKKFRFRQLKYTLAPTLAQKVLALAQALDSVPITVGNLPQTPTGRSTPLPRKLPNESQAAYNARVQAAQRARQTVRPPTSSAQPSAEGESPVYLDADERTNRILMIGLDDQLDRVEELIDTLDVAQQDLRTLKLYKIDHVDAGDVKNKLSELGIISASQTTMDTRRTGRITGQRPGTTSTSAAIAAQARSQPQTSSLMQGTQSEGLTLTGEPQVVVIEATNSLLVNATAEQHTQIDTILGYVDSTTEDSVMPYVIYPLESQKPEELAGVLKELIETTIKNEESKTEQVVKKTDEQIEIVPDEKSFSIIVYASKKNQEWIKKLIETLDKPRPQVLIDVTLVEVSKTDSFEYDLNLVESFPDLLTTSGQTGVANDILDSLLSAKRDRFIDVQSSGGEGRAYYADQHVQALLKLMQQKEYGRILAKPKVLVNDNEEGTISTTRTTYVQKTSSIPVTTGTAGTSGDLIQTSVDYADYQDGIELAITPHISEGDLLRLEITLNRQDFGAITGEKPPDTVGSDLNTIVTVPDGSTIILGGMIKLNQSKGGTKVPILGDIPLLGTLFRSVSNSDIQTKLYVFVKAEIIRPAKDFASGLPDLEEISMRNRKAFETFEERFQKYENIPGMRSGPMDPLKVLDAQ